MWVREIGLLRAYMDKNDNSWDQFLMALQDWGGLEQDTCDEIRQLIVRNR